MFGGLLKIHFFLVDQPLEWGTPDLGFSASFSALSSLNNCLHSLLLTWPQNNSLLIATAAVTIVPYPKLSSV